MFLLIRNGIPNCLVERLPKTFPGRTDVWEFKDGKVFYHSLKPSKYVVVNHEDEVYFEHRNIEIAEMKLAALRPLHYKQMMCTNVALVWTDNRGEHKYFLRPSEWVINDAVPPVEAKQDHILARQPQASS